MKTIGLLGGMSWESSLEYYRIINQAVKRRLGGLHSAQCLLYSYDFAEIEALQHGDEWGKLTLRMIDGVRRLQAGGADFLVICTNTMHRMAEAIEEAIGIPLLHIADATASAIKKSGLKTVGLLGTQFTMTGDFYRKRLEEKHGLRIIIPDEKDRKTVHRIIYDELVQGQIKVESRKAYLQVINHLQAAGAQGVILGCTEIPLLIKPSDVEIPIFDTTAIHAEAAVDWALES
ncbi:MAG: aspartate/glutamate racemase family protein [Brevefilum sp.]